LDLALPEQQALDGVQGPLAAFWRIEGLPPGVLDRYLQEGEKSRQSRLQGLL